MSAFSDRNYRGSFLEWSKRDRDRNASEELRLAFLIDSFRDSARFHLWQHVHDSIDLLAAEVTFEDELRFLTPESLFGLASEHLTRIDGAGFDGDRLDRAYLLAVHGWLDKVMDVTDMVATFREEVFAFVADWVLGELLFGDDPQRGWPLLVMNLSLVPHAIASRCTPNDLVEALAAEVSPRFLHSAWSAGITHSESIITGFRLGLTVIDLVKAGSNEAFPPA